MLAERILFLDGLPNFQLLGRLRIGETVEEILKADLALEMDAVPQLKNAIEYCEQVRDYVSRDLFRRILVSEEEHRSEEHTSELQSLMRISYAVFCLKKNKENHEYNK